MSLKLSCLPCAVTLCNDSEDELADLADLAAQHALSVHGHKPPREHVMAGIRHHNR